jgi:hypothetical protein
MDDRGIYVVELEWLHPDSAPAVVRERLFALVGSFAETSTHVRELRDGTFDVTTGVLEGDSPFRSHGHLVRLHVRRAA